MRQYELSPSATVLTHAPASNVALINDNEIEEALNLEARVRSGDYFVTLATALDTIGKDVEDWQTRTALEDIISDLIHLQENYRIIKNERPE